MPKQYPPWVEVFRDRDGRRTGYIPKRIFDAMPSLYVVAANPEPRILGMYYRDTLLRNVNFPFDGSHLELGYGTDGYVVDKLRHHYYRTIASELVGERRAEVERILLEEEQRAIEAARVRRIEDFRAKANELSERYKSRSLAKSNTRFARLLNLKIEKGSSAPISQYSSDMFAGILSKRN